MPPKQALRPPRKRNVRHCRRHMNASRGDGRHWCGLAKMADPLRVRPWYRESRLRGRGLHRARSLCRRSGRIWKANAARNWGTMRRDRGWCGRQRSPAARAPPDYRRSRPMSARRSRRCRAAQREPLRLWPMPMLSPGTPGLSVAPKFHSRALSSAMRHSFHPLGFPDLFGRDALPTVFDTGLDDESPGECGQGRYGCPPGIARIPRGARGGDRVCRGGG